MNEQTQRAIVQRLNLDKPILAIEEETQRLTLYLLGGEVVQVELEPPPAQLPFAGLQDGQGAKVAAAEPAPVVPEGSPKRASRKG